MLAFTIDDMTCGHCVGSITKAIQALDPAAKVAAELATHCLSVQSHCDAKTVENTIRDAGFTPRPQ